MGSIRVAINGFGTIGKRVARAVQAQPDMVVSGVTKLALVMDADLQSSEYLYCTDDDPERIKSFDGTKYDITGGLRTCCQYQIL